MPSNRRNVMADRIDYDTVKREAVGRWIGIYASLGIEVGIGGKYTTCPLCGKKDKFRMDNKDGKGSWVCVCGAGDGWKMVQETHNIGFVAAMELVAPIIGAVEIQEVREKKSNFTKEYARKIFQGGKRADRKNPVGVYLRNRGLDTCPNTLWYHPAMMDETTKRPAMVACITTAAGEVIALHRTFITVDGKKAEVKEVRKTSPIMAGVKDKKGASIRLFPPAHEVIGVAEGIETALACYAIHGIPTWATVSADGMIKWEPPEGIPLKKVFIFGDNDKSFTGQSAAYQLAYKLTVLRKIECEVLIPDGEGMDWLDELVARKSEESRSGQTGK
jgi:putative DNA primase/helicase